MSRSLQFDIVANDKASAKLKEVQGVAGQFAKSITGMFGGMMSLQAVIGRIASFVQQAFSWGSELKDSAAAVGLTATEFQQLEYAALQSGVAVDKMQKALKDVRKTLKEAGQGDDKATKLVKALGFSDQEIKSGSVNAMDALMRISEAISAAKTEQDKFNIATAFFSERYAQDLIAVLNDYKKLKQTIAETPLLSQREIEELDRIADRYERIKRTAEVVSMKVASKGEEGGRLAMGPLGTLLRAAEIAMSPTPDKTGPTEEAKRRAEILAAAGKKEAQMSSLSKADNYSQMAAIGGAAGFRAGAKSPELTTLEQIEANTRPAMPTPINGSTNFSAPEAYHPGQQELNAAAGRIRSMPRRRDIAPR